MKKGSIILAAAVMTAALLSGNTVSAEQSSGFSYADLANVSFGFSSGAGAWGTTMEIAEDGSFSGTYHDTNAGESGDGYNGTVYMSEFRGQLGELTQVNKNAYEAEITSLQIRKEKGTSEIKDGMRYVYDLPYGLLDADGAKPTSKLTFYVKGTPVSSIKTVHSSFETWAYRYVHDDIANLEECCILNNEAEQWFIGYVSNDAEAESAESSTSTSYPEPWNTKLTNALNQAAQLEASYQSAASSNRYSISNQLYYVWDDLLNEIWQSYSEGTKNQLLNEQLAWIKNKESVQYSYSDQAEGMMYAAQTTKERVYYLLQYVS